jgi:UDP-2-acetamido-2,6-beta-L-arabino-hexul-4-ose reductase
MRVVVTGADGFIGSNLCVRLRELQYDDIVSITRATTREQLYAAVAAADFVFHLAGVNRPKDETEFVAGNEGFTTTLCDALAAAGRQTPVAYASSTQRMLDNAYGQSKRASEEVLMRYSSHTGAPIHLFRLTNVFGKWCRPHYNSAVATFCHQIARGLPITVNDSAAPLRLLYIDDAVNAFVRLLGSRDTPGGYLDPGPVYDTTVGEIVQMLRDIAESRTSLLSPRVGVGLVRALYSTYVSFLPPELFDYKVPCHADSRGVFVETLKTPDCGQFSYFTAIPGVTRGEHYHHSKTEKFLVIQGTARFGFRQIRTGQMHELIVRGGEGRIVETVPGWTHNVTNIGENELIVMLWANEIFDRERPDTIALKVAP